MPTNRQSAVSIFSSANVFLVLLVSYINCVDQSVLIVPSLATGHRKRKRNAPYVPWGPCMMAKWPVPTHFVRGFANRTKLKVRLSRPYKGEKIHTYSILHVYVY